MLAKLADNLPAGAFLYEPKWDGFRAIVFRGESDVFIQSRDLRPLDRYFPELHAVLLDNLTGGCVVDGEIVIVRPHGLDFDALQMRLHPAASRVAKLSKEIPSSFVAFDLLAAGGQSLVESPQSERREWLERLMEEIGSPLYLTPMTRDRWLAAEPLERGQGSLVGAAPGRTRMRSEVRPPAGQPVPPRGGLPAVAAGQAAPGLPLRSARSDQGL